MTRGARSAEARGESGPRASDSTTEDAGGPPPVRAREARNTARSPLGPALTIAAAGLAVLLLPLLALSGRDELLPLDREVGRTGRELALAGARTIAEVVTVLGSFPIVVTSVIAAAVALAVARRAGASLALLLGFAVVVAAVHLIKADVGRLRPPGADPSLTTASFPSGHAAYATAYSALALALTGGPTTRRATRRAAVGIGLGLTVLIGLTRVVLGVHYLSDVIAGWALGATIFGLAAAALVTVDRMRHTERRVGGTSPEGSSVPP